MKCSGCGREDGLARRGRVFECLHCRAVTVAPELMPGVSGAEPVEEDEEAARLAAIQARAQAERAAKEEQARRQPQAARSSCLPCWATLLAVLLLGGVAGTLLLLRGTEPGVARPPPDAKDLLALAEQGDVGAQLAVGLVYHHGLAGNGNAPGQAGKWYLKAAQAGDVNAQYHVGLWYQSAAPSPNPQEALQWLNLAAERGHAGAQTRIGDAYRFGHHRERDLQQAADWYARAAEQGDLDALCSLARLNAGAEGFAQDQIAASMYDALASALGRECPRGAGVADAPDWAKAAGVRRAKERLAKGFGRKQP
jgi:hypothetical protein